MSEPRTPYDVKMLLPVSLRIWAYDEQDALSLAAAVQWVPGTMTYLVSVGFPEWKGVEPVEVGGLEYEGNQDD